MITKQCKICNEILSIDSFRPQRNTCRDCENAIALKRFHSNKKVKQYLPVIDLENEIWKEVKGYEGAYMVSNMGRVKSTDRNRFRKLINQNVIYPGKLMKLHPDASGYLRVTLCRNGKRELHLVHHLVFWNFNLTTNHKQGFHIDHINQNQKDNRFNNLQYIKERYNYIKRSLCSRKTSKYTGVCWDKSRIKWKANIRIKNKAYSLGRFDNEEDAALAYLQKLKEIQNQP